MVPTCGLDLCPSARGVGKRRLGPAASTRVQASNRKQGRGAGSPERKKGAVTTPEGAHSSPANWRLRSTQGTLSTLWEPPVRLWTPERMVATHSYLLPAHSKSTPDTPKSLSQLVPGGLDFFTQPFIFSQSHLAYLKFSELCGWRKQETRVSVCVGNWTLPILIFSDYNQTPVYLLRKWKLFPKPFISLVLICVILGIRDWFKLPLNS